MPIHDIRLDALDISFVLENAKDFALETGGWDIHGIVTSAKPVLQSYQEVANGICNHTNPFTNVLRVTRYGSSAR